MSILIQNVILDGGRRDIYIENDRIARIAPKINKRAEHKIDGKGGSAVLQGLINCHTHSAMTLFRGYADDLPLKDWLDKIWPLEAKLSEEDVYWGTKLAILEMLKTGTVCFNDMYWHSQAAVEAAEEMGIRAVIGLVLLDGSAMGSKECVEGQWRTLSKRKLKTTAFSAAPHSIYTVSRENLVWAKNFAKKQGLILHTHISETEKEIKDCQREHGVRPVEYLDRINFLAANTVLAHSVWLSEREIEILARRGCSAVYCPSSNMKLAVGEVFPGKKLKEAGVKVVLGTDGPASNNSLDLFEEMKIGSLLQKHVLKDSTAAGAREAVKWASSNAGGFLKIDAGPIREGRPADLILIDLNCACLSPSHNFASDIVYCSPSHCVSDVICNGKLLMRRRKVEGEERIVKQAAIRAKNLVKPLLS